MKNILAENLLRFGAKNLKEADRKKIEETVLAEQVKPIFYPNPAGNRPNVKEKNLLEDTNFTKTATALLSKAGQTENNLQPINVGQYILVPRTNDGQGYIDGTIIYFESGDYGLPLPTSYNPGGTNDYFVFRNNKLETAYILRGIFDGQQEANSMELSKYINEMFTTFPTLPLAYNADPNKSNFDIALQTIRTNIAKTPANENSNEKIIAKMLTGRAKAFYKLEPATAMTTTQPTPSRQ